MVGGRWGWLLAALLLAGCGYQSSLTRLPPAGAGDSANRAALRAAERTEVREGLKLPPTAQPQRVDDLTVKLDKRPDDPFALPPAGTDVTPTPFPGDPPPSSSSPAPAPGAEGAP